MNSESTYCIGCENIFPYDQYLSHIVGGYCEAEISRNSAHTDDGELADDEMEYENTNEIQPIDLDNPMIDNGFPNNIQEIVHIEQMLSTMGLGYIDCYGSKIQILDNTQCSICLDTYSTNSVFYKMICTHEFCELCAERWFSVKCKCPICNQNLQDLTHM